MLLQQSFPIAHSAMMSLDKDAITSYRHNTGRRKWPRTDRKNLNRLAAIGKLAQKRSHLVHGERGPICLYQ
jgi:hypothetical protein